MTSQKGLPTLFSHFVRNSEPCVIIWGDDSWRAINSLRQRFNSMPRHSVW